MTERMVLTRVRTRQVTLPRVGSLKQYRLWLDLIEGEIPAEHRAEAIIEINGRPDDGALSSNALWERAETPEEAAAREKRHRALRADALIKARILIMAHGFSDEELRGG